MVRITQVCPVVQLVTTFDAALLADACWAYSTGQVPSHRTYVLIDWTCLTILYSSGTGNEVMRDT